MKELLEFLCKWLEGLGEKKRSGKVIVQTYNPENFCIEHAKEQDYDTFYNTEIAIRKSLNYPPFCDIIMIGISGEKEEEVIRVSNKLYDMLKSKMGSDSNMDIFKPGSAPVGKIKNKYRWRIIAKCKLNNNAVNMINATLEEYYKLKYKEVTVVVDVNPNSMV
jgi:primosomal protein N' (replication factor Y)